MTPIEGGFFFFKVPKFLKLWKKFAVLMRASRSVLLTALLVINFIEASGGDTLLIKVFCDQNEKQKTTKKLIKFARCILVLGVFCHV